MAQGFHGSARGAQVPSLLEAYQIPYTFSDATTMTLCQNKSITKMILDHYMIPNAPFTLVPNLDKGADSPELNGKMPTYPLFVKPVTEGSWKGIDEFNKVRNPKELKPAILALASRFPGQEILVESFLSGREFTVSILGTGPHCRVIGIREHLWRQSPEHSNTNGYHSDQSLDYACRASKSSTAEPHIKAMSEVALDAWKVSNCCDCGRVDIRFDSEESGSTPNVLEVNPIAGLYPGHSPLPATAEVNGLSFEDLLSGY